LVWQQWEICLSAVFVGDSWRTADTRHEKFHIELEHKESDVNFLRYYLFYPKEIEIELLICVNAYLCIGALG
jgi:hypothetical protein